MSKLSSVIHRFGAVFLAGGLSSLLILFGATSSVDDIKKFGISLVVAFVSGGIAALEKVLTNDYPVITPIIPLVNNEIATVTSKIAPTANILAKVNSDGSITMNGSQGNIEAIGTTSIPGITVPTLPVSQNLPAGTTIITPTTEIPSNTSTTSTDSTLQPPVL